MTDLEIVQAMLKRAGVEFQVRVPADEPNLTVIQLVGGFAGFYTELTFDDGALKSIEAYE
jgi:hypothetical protein